MKHYLGGMSTTRPESATGLTADMTRALRRAGRNSKVGIERRNELIRQAHAAGGGVREIARAVELDHTSVLNVLRPKRREP